MTQPSALLVLGATDPFHQRLAEAATTGLERRFTVTCLDLVAQGFVMAMSAEERRAYHGNHPILDPQVASHARLVAAAAALVFVFPTRLWTPPPLVKGWLERVLAPGVAFVFDSQHRVRPNLRTVRSIGGITTTTQTAAEVRAGGDGSRTTVLRTLRLNVPGRVRTAWYALYEYEAAAPGAKEEFVAQVARGMGRL